MCGGGTAHSGRQPSLDSQGGRRLVDCEFEDLGRWQPTDADVGSIELHVAYCGGHTGLLFVCEPSGCWLSGSWDRCICWWAQIIVGNCRWRGPMRREGHLRLGRRLGSMLQRRRGRCGLRGGRCRILWRGRGRGSGRLCLCGTFSSTLRRRRGRCGFRGGRCRGSGHARIRLLAATPTPHWLDMV